ncbi:hypothetical protein NMY22_g1848 [Coprinellus aureogranulatus]|nr:hypothetical protein NMY22_g1848 [Coprinellus aureogranulatus]
MCDSGGPPERPPSRGPDDRTPSGARYPHCKICGAPKLGHQRVGCSHAENTEGSPTPPPSRVRSASIPARSASAPPRAAAASSTGPLRIAQATNSSIHVNYQSAHSRLGTVKEEPESASGAREYRNREAMLPIEAYRQYAVVADLHTALQASALRLVQFDTSNGRGEWEFTVVGDSTNVELWVTAIRTVAQAAAQNRVSSGTQTEVPTPTVIPAEAQTAASTNAQAQVQPEPPVQTQARALPEVSTPVQTVVQPQDSARTVDNAASSQWLLPGTTQWWLLVAILGAAYGVAIPLVIVVESSPKSPEPAKAPTGKKRKARPSALEQGPRKRPETYSAQTDPLVHHGRHFGRTVFAFANMQALLLAGLAMDQDEPPETQQERREYRVFRKLLKMVPSLEERLLAESTDEGEVLEIAALLQKGASSARSDDTKSIKGAIIDWISPADGEPLRPSLARNMKADRGYNHERTGLLLCPAGMDWSDPEVKIKLKNKELVVPGNHWPLFVYRNEVYDEEEPWKGLFRSQLLVSAYKHIFTSPSSVDSDPKATRSGNARIHGMTSVTPPSIAYVATQVRFALSSASIFCRTDKETDSETFYTSVLEVFEDPEEQDEVKDLIACALSRIKARRAALKAALESSRRTATDIATPSKNKPITRAEIVSRYVIAATIALRRREGGLVRTMTYGRHVRSEKSTKGGHPLNNCPLDHRANCCFSIQPERNLSNPPSLRSNISPATRTKHSNSADLIQHAMAACLARLRQQVERVARIAEGQKAPGYVMLFLVPGGRFLLTVGGREEGQKSSICLWDLGHNIDAALKPFPVATMHSFKNAKHLTAAPRSNGRELMVAIICPGGSSDEAKKATILRITPQSLAPKFCVQASLEFGNSAIAIESVHLSEDTAVIKSMSGISVWNWVENTGCQWEDVDIDLFSQAAVIDKTVIVMDDSQNFLIYDTPPLIPLLDIEEGLPNVNPPKKTIMQGTPTTLDLPDFTAMLWPVGVWQQHMQPHLCFTVDEDFARWTGPRLRLYSVQQVGRPANSFLPSCIPMCGGTAETICTTHPQPIATPVSPLYYCDGRLAMCCRSSGHELVAMSLPIPTENSTREIQQWSALLVEGYIGNEYDGHRVGFCPMSGRVVHIATNTSIQVTDFLLPLPETLHQPSMYRITGLPNSRRVSARETLNVSRPINAFDGVAEPPQGWGTPKDYGGNVFRTN